VVTCVDLDRLDESWLGRVVDPDFAREIEGAGVDACGENGEYHSFAFAGPAFRRRFSWAPGARRREGRFLQMDVASSPAAGR
jgi:diphthamide synthase (EF-2-diphthine--ammonia ligase)